VRERALGRLAVDVAAPRGGEDRDVGTQVAEDAAPVARRVLVEERPLGCLEAVDQRSAVAARALVARAQVGLHVGAERAEEAHELLQALLLLLPGDAEIADADLVGGGELRSGPHTGVLAREDAHHDVFGEAHALAARHRHELSQGNARRLHHAQRLVGAEDARAGPARDPLGAEEVVEMRVPDHDPVRPLDLVDPDPHRRGRRDAGGGGVEAEDEAPEREPEGRAAEPVERGSHGADATPGGGSPQPGPGATVVAWAGARGPSSPGAAERTARGRSTCCARARWTWSDSSRP